jgi:hypothetical protein
VAEKGDSKDKKKETKKTDRKRKRVNRKNFRFSSNLYRKTQIDIMDKPRGKNRNKQKVTELNDKITDLVHITKKVFHVIYWL